MKQDKSRQAPATRAELAPGARTPLAAGALRRRRYRGALSLIALALVLSCLVPLHLAQAMTQDVTTARSNETSTNNVLGGVPTRITWEAVAEAGDEISQVTLQLPEGSAFTEDTTVRITVLDGTERLDVGSEVNVDSEGLSVDISLDQALTEGQRLRVELYRTSLPLVSGEVSLGASYVDGQGNTVDMGASPSIEVTYASLAERISNWLDGQAWVQAWNSVTLFKLFFEPQLIVESIPTVAVGWLLSLMLVCFGFPLAIPIGLAAAFMKISNLRILKILASLYTGVIRGTPLFLQIYIAFFGLPLLGLNVNDYVLAVLVMSINSGAYLCEIFRAGIQSIPRGQFEAARSLGMSSVQTMFWVIIPQTVRRVLPTMTSEFILLYKDTSLLAAVGVMEMMLYSRSIVANTGNMTPYIVAAAFYLVVTLPLIHLVNRLELRLSAGEAPGSGGRKKKKTRRGAFVQMKEELAGSAGAAAGVGADVAAHGLDTAMGPEANTGADTDSGAGATVTTTLAEDARLEAAAARRQAQAEAGQISSSLKAAASLADNANYTAVRPAATYDSAGNAGDNSAGCSGASKGRSAGHTGAGSGTGRE